MEGRRQQRRESEGASKGTHIENSWAQTMEGIDCGSGGSVVGVNKGEKAGQL